MDFDLMILPECFIDTTLAETLSFPSCNKVLSEMNKKSNIAVLGIIDDDKCVPALFNSFELMKRHNDLAIYKHNEKPHYIIKISKAAEDFILKNAEKCGISMADYNLPDNLSDLIKQTKKITAKNDINLKHLFSALKQNENSDFYKLAEWIELFKTNPYNLENIIV